MNQGENAIAVVGMSGRFPDAPDLEAFWTNLRDGFESIRSLSEDDLLAAGVPRHIFEKPNYVRAATVLDEIDLFDADFFGYAPLEAQILDPQHRLFLESAWAALEDAGYAIGTPEIDVGVFASVSMNTYREGVIYRNPELAMASGGYQLMLGNDKDFLTTRVSYKLDLKGPSVVVQTACSSSLVAVEVGVRSLLNHQCDLALVGGSSVTIPQETGYLFQEGMIFSPDGHCRPFDSRAGGIRAGHGVGVVALKRLADARADGDRIRAVLLGAAINNDGAGKVGYTAPSIGGQSEVISRAQAMAGINAETIGYIEAHGTATRIGDPIEVTALTDAFRRGTDGRQYCAIGSLKSNLGHLDAAAGIAGVIKTVLALEKKQIPPSLNFEEPNPDIDFEASPFFVNTELRDWPNLEGPRRAGVSSFGIGGTNAHVVLEEAPTRTPTESADRASLIVLSAKSSEALSDATHRLGDFLNDSPELGLADVAFTSQVGRTAMPYRKALVASTPEEAASVLTGSATGSVLQGLAPDTPAEVAFMFTGQGSQYPEMGRELYERYRLFREPFDACMALASEHLNLDLAELVLTPAAAETPSVLEETRLTQPALFALEYALAKLWMSWGVQPTAMIGHSIGEWVAAHLSGVFSLEDAVALVCERGRLMQARPPGVMFSVSLPEQEVRSLIDEAVSVAAVNSPSLCAVSGPGDVMAALADRFTAEDVPYRKLHTSHAFHSEMMDPVIPEFVAEVQKVTLGNPSIPFLSNVSGGWITDEQATDPQYWGDQIRHAVRFLDGIRELARTPDRIFIEVGPGQTLTTFARQALDLGSVNRVVPSLPHVKDPTPGGRFLLGALSRLWLEGVDVAWDRVNLEEPGRRVGLPTYPFQRKRYWVDPSSHTPQGWVETEPEPEVTRWFYSPSWARTSILSSVGSPRGIEPEEWLLFEEGQAVLSDLESELRSLGHTSTRVTPGTEFVQTDANSFVIRPGRPEDYDRMMEILEADGRLPDRIVHAWTLGGGADPDSRLASSVAGLDRGFFSIVFLAQSLGRIGAGHSSRLLALTEGMVSVVDAEEARHPENATLLGPCSTLPFESPWIDSRVVDITDFDGWDAGDLPYLLIQEASLDRPVPLVAYRHGARWEPFMERLYFGPVEKELDRPELDSGGPYLITGGLGGLGLAFAKHLAQGGPTVLVLVGRTPLPERSRWEAIVADGGDVRNVEAIRTIQDLEVGGHTILPFAADVADEGRMTEIIEEVERDHGPIAGIIHGAGVPATGVIQLKTRDQAESVLDPKVKGTLILDALVGERPLEFFVLFSSINAWLPAGGGSDYCAANAFLDSFALYRRARGDRNVISIGWDAWSEVGMAVDTEVPQEMQAAKETALRNGIPTLGGLEAFDRSLASGLSQILVSRQPVQELLATLMTMKGKAGRSSGEESAGLGASVPEAETAAEHSRPDLPQAYVAPETPLEETLARIWQTLLGIQPVGTRDNFFELGGHSLLAVRVLAYIQEKTGVSLPLEVIFEAPTILDLAERVETVQWMTEDQNQEGGSEEDREEFVF